MRMGMVLMMALLAAAPALAADAPDYYIGPRPGADVLAHPRASARVLAHLPRLTPVEVLKQRRSWWKVRAKADHGERVEGWVSAGAVRERYKPKKRSSSFGFASFFSLFRSPPEQHTAVLGVRGLEDEGKLAKATQASKKVVEWMDKLHVDPAKVDEFVREGDLNP